MIIPEQKQSTVEDSKSQNRNKENQISIGKQFNIEIKSSSQQSSKTEGEISIIAPIPIHLPDDRNNPIPTSKEELTLKENLSRNQLQIQNPPESPNEIPQNQELQVQVSPSKIQAADQKPNSLGGVIFVLAKTCIGSTVFTLAIRAKQMGLFWLLFFILVSGLLNVWSILRMVQSAKDLKLRDYSDVVKHLLGSKAALTLNIIIMVYTFLTKISYLALIYALIGRFIKGVVYFKDERYPTFNEYESEVWGTPLYKFLISIGMAILLAGVSMQKDLKKLNFAGYFGMLANFYIVLVVVIECNSYYEQYKGNPEINFFNIKPAFGPELEFFNSLSTLVHSFTCHTSVFPTFETFKNCPGDTQLMTKAVIYSCLIEFGYFILCAVPAFLTNPLNPEDVILYREPLNKDSKDIPMNIAKAALALGLFFSIPLYYNSFRQCFVKTFFKGELTCKVNTILTFVSFLLIAVVSASYDKILHYINYIGGFIDVFFCYLFPALMFIQANGKGFKYWKNILELGLAVLLVGIGFTSGIVTIIADVKGH